ncbi:MAG: hypothetical protein K9G46_15515 [Flavobacteriales bacterium]|nr:hypothetical protein [Flavobacteriales bacterium]
MTQEEFDILLEANAPHPVLRKDWRMYYPRQFADTFLPKATLIKGKTALWVYDGAKVFTSVDAVAPASLSLDGSGKLIQLFVFTYPKGVAADTKKLAVRASEDEVLLFMEVLQDDTVEMIYRFGSNFKKWLREQKLNANALESKTYISFIERVRKHFSVDDQKQAA